MQEPMGFWQHADAVFDTLLDVPAEQRWSQLASMELDDNVRARTEALLSAHQQAHGPLDAPLMVQSRRDSLAGRRVGVWTLDQEIGRGGMAIVYSAHTWIGQVRRIAAVKLMTLGMIASHGADRFRSEQAILARMNHPHIARLFDVGVAEDGTPWLAMALIEGEQIDVWCQTHQLGVRSIVQLLLDVCRAVAHAHQNLVIHRDIKPSNVLIDADGHAYLLDFGIARLIDDASDRTATVQRVLTPQYAAPEQVAGSPPTTAMDVYGLGALLHRLTCGETPASHQEDDRVRLPTHVRRYRRHGDLDAIIEMATAAEPQHRYPTVWALVDDLQRWIDNEMVQARKPNLLYRAMKFVRRHRWGVLAGAFICLVMIGGWLTTSWQADRARTEWARAHVVQEFLVGLFESANPESSSSSMIDAQSLLARGAQNARSELADGVLKAELLMVVGAIQTRLGQFDQAERQLADAQSMAENVSGPPSLRGRIAVELGMLRVGQMRLNDAIDWLDRAIGLLDEDPDWQDILVEAYLQRASSHEFLGNLDQALADQSRAERIEARIDPPSARRRVNVMANQARTLWSSGRPHEADARLASALRAIRIPNSDDYSLYVLMGSIAEDINDWSRAEENYRRGVEIVRDGYPADSAFIALPLTYLGSYLARTGRMDEANRLLREALAIRRLNSTGSSVTLAMPLMNVGAVARDMGRYDEALSHLREARQLSSDDPIGGLLISAQMARVLAERGQASEAVDEVRHALVQADALTAAGIRNPAKMSRAYGWLAMAMLQSSRSGDALHLLERARVAEIGSTPAAVPIQMFRSGIHLRSLLSEGRIDEAVKESDAIALKAASLQRNAVIERTGVYLALAHVALAKGDPGQASEWANEAAGHEAGSQIPVYLQVDLESLRRLLDGP